MPSLFGLLSMLLPSVRNYKRKENVKCAQQNGSAHHDCSASLNSILVNIC